MVDEEVINWTTMETCRATAAFRLGHTEVLVECGKMPHDEAAGHEAIHAMPAGKNLYFHWVIDEKIDRRPRQKAVRT